eukprot:9893403-Prorocentrum_lima.AAC.1
MAPGFSTGPTMPDAVLGPARDDHERDHRVWVLGAVQAHAGTLCEGFQGHCRGLSVNISAGAAQNADMN